MKDRGYFTSDKERLYYVAHVPNSLGVHRKGVIFIHAASSNRFGPHRMFVEYAEKLSNAGSISIRLDLTGCGDSSGDPLDDSAMHQKDIVSAIHYFRDRYSLDSLYLLGISRGAYLAFKVLCENKLPVKGAILLSCPVSSQKAAIRSFSSRLKGYWLKLFDPKSLKKFILGQANVRFILKSLTTALTMKKRYLTDYKSQSSAYTSCPMLFIYGQNDPICSESSQYYKTTSQRLDISHKEHVVPYANHSFFHYSWKEDIYEVLIKWLNSNIKAAEEVAQDEIIF